MNTKQTVGSFPIFCGFRDDQADGWHYQRASNGSGLILRKKPEPKLFHDRCPHRGSAILDGHSCFQEQLTCPYHHWKFNTDGSCLQGADDQSLTEASLQDLGGFLLGSSAPTQLPILLEQEIGSFFDCIRTDLLRCVAKDTHSVKAPWNIWCENFLECMHCFANHPELRQSEAHILPAHKGDHAAICDVYERTLLALKQFDVTPPTQAFWSIDDSVPGFWNASLMAHEGHATLDRVAAGPSIFKSEKHTNAFFYGAIGPLIHFTVYSDYVFIHNVIPIGPEATDIECSWFALTEPNDTENLTWLWNNTICQDIELVERLWVGRNGMINFTPVFAEEEYQTKRFFSWHQSNFGLSKLTG